MSLQYIRDYYDVPAKRGGRVTFLDSDGAKHYGAITSADRQYLRVLFDGDREPLLCHPKDLEYFKETLDA